MSPNCIHCDEQEHALCQDQWCECRTKGRHSHPALKSDVTKVDMQTGETIPNYVALDLWMALGHEPNHEFDDAIAVRGVVDVWSFLLAEVRALNNRGFEERVSVVKEAAMAERGDPLYLRAKGCIEDMHLIESVESTVDFDEVVRNGRGEIVSGSLHSRVIVSGRLY